METVLAADLIDFWAMTAYSRGIQTNRCISDSLSATAILFTGHVKYRAALMGLAELPDDILLHIASALSIKDVLALKQVGPHPSCPVARLTTEHADLPCPTRVRVLRLSLA